MTEFSEIRIIDELRKCIESFDKETRDIFNFYCLGKRFNSIIESDTLEDYLSLVDKALKEQNNQGRKFVVFKSLTCDHQLVERYYWSRESPGYYSQGNYYLINRYGSYKSASWTCFATKSNNNKASFKFDFNHLNANCCMVFLIHPSIQSFDEDELATFASKWDEWFHRIIDIYPTPQFRFYFGNRKNIYSGNTPPTHQEVKNTKINVSYELPVKSYAYEEF